MKYIIYFICCIVVFGSFTLRSEGQCCAAGNPSSTNCSVAGGGEGMLNVSLSYMHSLSDTYFNGTTEAVKVYYPTVIRESYFNFASLSMSYGLTSRLRLTADMGYFIDKSQQFESGYNRYTSGIADGAFGLVFSAYKSDDNLFEILQSARVTLPVGDFKQEFDGVVMPIDFQPSSGNYKYNLGLILSKQFKNSSFSVMSANSIEFSQMIETDRTFHKYGNLYNLSLTGAYSINSMISAMLQLRCEIRDKALTGSKSDSLGRYTYINASGGVLAYISPQINVNVPGGFMFTLQYNQPLYKNINGEQLTNSNSFMAGFSKSFNLSGGEEMPGGEENLPDATLLNKQISVNGKCEMCKSRIEEVTNEIRNVASSEWDKDTKILTVYYLDTEPDTDRIEKALADAGHDTDKYKADDKVYNALPKCCHYRDK